MKNPDLNEILNNKIGDLVDLLHTGFKAIAEVYELNNDQISEMEKDFIARLAFAAIIGDDEKEDEKEPEKEPEKESENKKVPDVVWKWLNYVKDYCKERECDGCVFSEDVYCKIKYTPNKWKV